MPSSSSPNPVSAEPLPTVSDEGLPTVTVVVPCFNVGSIIERCIRALLGQDYPQGKLTVVIVNDGSTDDTQSRAEGLGIRVLSHKARKGRAAALNTALEAALSEIIVFTNADCVPDQNWVRCLASGYLDGSIGGVGGKTITPKSENACLELLRRLNYLDYRGPVDTETPLPMSNVSYRRDILVAVGGFDLESEYSGEDQDIWLKVREKGYRILYQEGAVVQHLHHAIKIRNSLNWWWIRGREFPRWLKKQAPGVKGQYYKQLFVFSLPAYSAITVLLLILSLPVGLAVVGLLALTMLLLLGRSSWDERGSASSAQLITVKASKFDMTGLSPQMFIRLAVVGLLSSFAFTSGKLYGSAKYGFLLL